MLTPVNQRYQIMTMLYDELCIIAFWFICFSWDSPPAMRYKWRTVSVSAFSSAHAHLEAAEATCGHCCSAATLTSASP